MRSDWVCPNRSLSLSKTLCVLDSDNQSALCSIVDISIIDYTMPKQKLSPLPSAAFQILLALVGEDLHGYGIMRNVAQQTEGRMRLGPGTLYSSIRALLEEELIEEVDRPRDPGVRDERRRYYRLTSLGRKLARSEAERLADLLRVARSKNILRGDYV
jgi:DNA-binding PadR family transcriptional regulator